MPCDSCDDCRTASVHQQQNVIGIAEDDFNKFMMTWDGQWGDDVEYQYQHYHHHNHNHNHNHHHHQQQQQQQLLHGMQLPDSLHSPDNEEAMPLISDNLIHYNRISVLSIAPHKLLPMIVSQVAQPI